jgi:hypothetical protein
LAFRRMTLLTRAFKTSAICAALVAASSPAWAEDQTSAPAGALPTLESLLQQKVPKPLEGQVDQNAAAAAASSTSPPFQMAEPSAAPVAAPVAPPPPVAKKKRHLEAGIQEQSLNGDADQNAGDLAGMSPSMDKSGNPLSGNATSLDSGVTSSDPDMDDQEMMVQWDKWHNRVLNAIQQGLIEQLTSTGDNVMYLDQRTGRMRSKYPLGTMAMFSCQVTPDHRIINLKIDQTSGFGDYDRAVYQAVNVLNGSSVLRYPKGSHRKVVWEGAGIRTSMQAGPANFHWGDTEHYRQPGNGGGGY